MHNLFKFFKYPSSFSLVNLANQVISNNFINTGDSTTDCNFDKLFKWRHFEHDFAKVKNVTKPVFLFIHRPLCSACQKLKQKFSKSVRLMDLSDRFVMIQADPDSCKNLNDRKFQPDGNYVPRILFFTSDGDFIEDAYNKHETADKEQKYFYYNPSQIVETMLFVLREYSKDPVMVTFQHKWFKSKNLNTEDEEIFSPISFP